MKHMIMSWLTSLISKNFQVCENLWARAEMGHQPFHYLLAFINSSYQWRRRIITSRALWFALLSLSLSLSLSSTPATIGEGESSPRVHFDLLSSLSLSLSPSLPLSLPINLIEKSLSLSTYKFNWKMRYNSLQTQTLQTQTL